MKPTDRCYLYSQLTRIDRFWKIRSLYSPHILGLSDHSSSVASSSALFWKIKNTRISILSDKICQLYCHHTYAIGTLSRFEQKLPIYDIYIYWKNAILFNTVEDRKRLIMLYNVCLQCEWTPTSIMGMKNWRTCSSHKYNCAGAGLCFNFVLWTIDIILHKMNSQIKVNVQRIGML